MPVAVYILSVCVCVLIVKLFIFRRLGSRPDSGKRETSREHLSMALVNMSMGMLPQVSVWEMQM